ncbi:MAG: DUF6266 family protein [Bacteroides sp.]|jgi:hypothetical protein|nr:DUF6266 family protein [Bacteroides sp.]
MAYSKEGVLANFKGRLGKMVVYQMNGKTVVRSMPTRKGGQVSPKLKESQGHFAKVMSVMAAVKPFIRIGFNDLAEGKFVFQRALSENLIRYKESENPDFFDWLLVSKGERAGAMDLNVQVLGNEAKVSWGDAKAGMPWDKNDHVLLLALNTVTLEETDNLKAGIRSKGQASLKLPTAEAGQPVLVFIAFYDLAGAAVKADPANISNSQAVKA